MYVKNRSRLVPGRRMKRFGMALGDAYSDAQAGQQYASGSNTAGGFSLPDSTTLTSQLDTASHAPGSPLAPAPTSSSSWTSVVGPLLGFLTPKPSTIVMRPTGMAQSTKIALIGGGALLLVAILARK